MTSSNPSDESRPSAVRLIFEYDGEEVRLVSQQRVDVAVTGFDIATTPRPGHYVEMRDAAGDPLVRVAIQGAAFARSAEVFPAEPGEPITRVDVERPQGAFTVVVPAPEAAELIAVLRVRPEPPSTPPVDAGATSGRPGEPEIAELGTFALEPMA